MSLYRKCILTLESWKKHKNRKPLVIRGARQVGKTTLVNNFAKEYDQYINLNLEKQIDVDYFVRYDNPKSILDAILLERNLQSIEEKQTLLFIDEIQEVPKAIALLRYFYEEIPNLHVIAAGSLLEHAMSQVKSFPVGRVQFMYLFPMNFQEYLKAHNKDMLLDRLHDVPVDEPTHYVAMQSFHKYALVGGMPEAVKLDVENQSHYEWNNVYESIWSSYRDDVKKYAQNNTEEKVIKHIMQTAPLHMDKRVTFQGFGNSNYRSREVGESFRSLDDAKIIQLIYPGTSVEYPLVIDYKKSPRLQFLDTGLLNYALGIQSHLIEIEDLSTSYKGAILPHLITQELISLQETSYRKPSFWVRQKKSSQAEVDLIYPYKNYLIPIEVKSGKVGKLRSLHQFIEQAPHQYAIRIYAGKFGIEKHKTPTGKPFFLMNMPYYLMTFIERYLDYFISEAKY